MGKKHTHFHCKLCFAAFESRGKGKIILGLDKHMKMHNDNYQILRSKQMDILKCKSKHKSKYLDPMQFCSYPPLFCVHFVFDLKLYVMAHRLLMPIPSVEKETKQLPSKRPSPRQILHHSQNSPLKDAFRMHILRAPFTGPLPELEIRPKVIPFSKAGKLAVFSPKCIFFHC